MDSEDKCSQGEAQSLPCERTMSEGVEADALIEKKDLKDGLEPKESARSESARESNGEIVEGLSDSTNSIQNAEGGKKKKKRNRHRKKKTIPGRSASGSAGESETTTGTGTEPDNTETDGAESITEMTVPLKVKNQTESQSRIKSKSPGTILRLRLKPQQTLSTVEETEDVPQTQTSWPSLKESTIQQTASKEVIQEESELMKESLPEIKPPESRPIVSIHTLLNLAKENAMHGAWQAPKPQQQLLQSTLYIINDDKECKSETNIGNEIEAKEVLMIEDVPVEDKTLSQESTSPIVEEIEMNLSSLTIEENLTGTSSKEVIQEESEEKTVNLMELMDEIRSPDTRPKFSIDALLHLAINEKEIFTWTDYGTETTEEDQDAQESSLSPIEESEDAPQSQTSCPSSTLEDNLSRTVSKEVFKKESDYTMKDYLDESTLSKSESLPKVSNDALINLETSNTILGESKSQTITTKTEAENAETTNVRDVFIEIEDLTEVKEEIELTSCPPVEEIQDVYIQKEIDVAVNEQSMPQLTLSSVDEIENLHAQEEIDISSKEQTESLEKIENVQILEQSTNRIVSEKVIQKESGHNLEKQIPEESTDKEALVEEVIQKESVNTLEVCLEEIKSSEPEAKDSVDTLLNSANENVLSYESETTTGIDFDTTDTERGGDTDEDNEDLGRSKFILTCAEVNDNIPQTSLLLLEDIATESTSKEVIKKESKPLVKTYVVKREQWKGETTRRGPLRAQHMELPSKQSSEDTIIEFDSDDENNQGCCGSLMRSRSKSSNANIVKSVKVKNESRGRSPSLKVRITKAARKRFSKE